MWTRLGQICRQQQPGKRVSLVGIVDELFAHPGRL